MATFGFAIIAPRLQFDEAGDQGSAFADFAGAPARAAPAGQPWISPHVRRDIRP